MNLRFASIGLEVTELFGSRLHLDSTTFETFKIDLMDLNPKNASEIILKAAENLSRGTPIRFINAWTLVNASENERYLKSVSSYGLNIIDGFSVRIMNQILGEVKIKRLRGADFTRIILSSSPPTVAHTFVVPDSKTGSELEKKLAREYKNVEINDIYVPPYFESDEEMSVAIAERIIGRKSHLNWIGIGSPKQDLVCDFLATNFPGVFIGCGAALGFIAGTNKESSILLQKLGLEWLHRLSREPSRLSRRYIYGNLKFLEIALRELLNK